MKLTDINDTLKMVRQAYQDSLDGKTVSFTGVNGRTITNHDPVALRKELEYWEQRRATALNRGATVRLARF